MHRNECRRLTVVRNVSGGQGLNFYLHPNDAMAHILSEVLWDRLTEKLQGPLACCLLLAFQGARTTDIASQ